MRSFLVTIAAALAVAAVPASVQAAPCKDAKGKFVKCPPAAAKTTTAAVVTKKVAKTSTTVKKAPCRDAKGRFAKCK